MKAGGWDRTLPGQVQVDLVEHCGQSASGLYGNTVSCAEIAFGWWEGEAVLGSGKERRLPSSMIYIEMSSGSTKTSFSQ